MARATKKANEEKSEQKPTAIVPKDRIVDAMMALAAEERFEDVSISRIAERAHVSLADFRDLFASKGAVLAAFNRRIDRIVLEGTSDDLADENSRERLFDVLMRRLDAMAPYKAGIEGIAEWAKREPIAAARLHTTVVNSMRFMLEAAGIDSEGHIGALKLQGLVIAWARIVRIWLRDEDAGLASTMAELDRTLTRGDTMVARAKDIDRVVTPFRTMLRGAIGAGMRLARDCRGKKSDADAAANEI